VGRASVRGSTRGSLDTGAGTGRGAGAGAAVAVGESEAALADVVGFGSVKKSTMGCGRGRSSARRSDVSSGSGSRRAKFCTMGSRTIVGLDEPGVRLRMGSKFRSAGGVVGVIDRDGL